MNTKKLSQEEKELEKVELLNEFQMEELEQRFEMRIHWLEEHPQEPGSSTGQVGFDL